ncbi:MAG: hypothetical protein ABFE02_17640 [Sulfuricella sp.]
MQYNAPAARERLALFALDYERLSHDPALTPGEQVYAKELARRYRAEMRLQPQTQTATVITYEQIPLSAGIAMAFLLVGLAGLIWLLWSNL